MGRNAIAHSSATWRLREPFCCFKALGVPRLYNHLSKTFGRLHALLKVKRFEIFGKAYCLGCVEGRTPYMMVNQYVCHTGLFVIDLNTTLKYCHAIFDDIKKHRQIFGGHVLKNSIKRVIWIRLIFLLSSLLLNWWLVLNTLILFLYHACCSTGALEYNTRDFPENET